MLLQLLSEYINRSKIIAKVAILSSNMMQTSRSKDTVKMAKKWSFYGPNMGLNCPYLSAFLISIK